MDVNTAEFYKLAASHGGPLTEMETKAWRATGGARGTASAQIGPHPLTALPDLSAPPPVATTGYVADRPAPSAPVDWESMRRCLSLLRSKIEELEQMIQREVSRHD